METEQLNTIGSPEASVYTDQCMLIRVALAGTLTAYRDSSFKN